MIFLAALLPLAVSAAMLSGTLRPVNKSIKRAGDKVRVTADINLDSLHLGATARCLSLLAIEGSDGQSVDLPSVLVNERNMHYAYERGSLSRDVLSRYTIAEEVRRDNGKPQSVAYSATVPFSRWMYDTRTTLRFFTDTCGCGRAMQARCGSARTDKPQPGHQHAPGLHHSEVTELPVTIHEGHARVQFEVDRTELHPSLTSAATDSASTTAPSSA